MPLLPVHVQACGCEGPIPLQASGSGDEGGSLKSGAEKATGASLSQVRDADLRSQQNTASLLGSAQLVLGIISSVEDAMHFSPRYCDPFPGFGRMFFQLGYLLARMGYYTRCSRRSWSWMLTFAPWDVFWGGSGFLGCGRYRMWSGVISITHCG